ncbi:hypothetical protein XI03_20855 [Bradyrhizobium sp. CCBAU 65884]|uniref:hypothetical protein n=1 Tax=Bradyrhizobium sp. CCBAU 65884 TaxID=722477 RepID=UPI002305CBDE|nr:hypothetical protein [Bradyrhizobium sp. CCBAU 65884]MDA9476891.1 hypothetical protein [Bradyrhizobium sp. CCBAU 65884]
MKNARTGEHGGIRIAASSGAHRRARKARLPFERGVSAIDGRPQLVLRRRGPVNRDAQLFQPGLCLKDGDLLPLESLRGPADGALGALISPLERPRIAFPSSWPSSAMRVSSFIMVPIGPAAFSSRPPAQRFSVSITIRLPLPALDEISRIVAITALVSFAVVRLIGVVDTAIGGRMLPCSFCDLTKFAQISMAKEDLRMNLLGGRGTARRVYIRQTRQVDLNPLMMRQKAQDLFVANPFIASIGSQRRVKLLMSAAALPMRYRAALETR